MSLRLGNCVNNQINHPIMVTTSPIGFRSNVQSDTKEVLQSDVVEIQNKKQKKSKLKKVAIGAGTLLATSITAITLVATHKTSQLTKLYKQKIVPKKITEVIDFKDAKSFEEAVKFAKETLGIKEISGFDKYGKEEALEALNWTNKALADVCNANKGGTVFIPQNLVYKEFKNSKALASVDPDIYSNTFADLSINRSVFCHEHLDKTLSEWIKPTIKTNTNSNSNTKEISFFVRALDNDYFVLKNKFLKQKETMTLREKLILRNTLYEGAEKIGFLYNNPLNTLKNLKEYIEKAGVKVDIEEISKLKGKDLETKFENIIGDYLKKTGKSIPIKNEIIAPEKTLYHEMGHLQDIAKNQAELHLKDWDKWNFIKVMKQAWNDAGKEVKTGIKTIDRHAKEIDNRWRGTTYKGYKELLENNPKKFKEDYPELYEHLTNPDTQLTAGKISWYAQTSIGEFIAETYAKMIQGHKIPDDVMALYKKYNGPIAGK